MHSAFTKTRIAPTPSGYLHLGNLASFVYTQGLARLFGAEMILRIDDLDKDRFRPEYAQDIIDTLNFAGFALCRQERTQASRLELYAEALEQLRNRQLLYACSCTRKDSGKGAASCSCLEHQLSLDQPGVQWRLLPNAPSQIELIDVKKGRETHSFPLEMTALQVRKKNGEPSYHLASVVDDIHFGINLIVRGMDLFPSSLAQLHLAELLGNNQFHATTFVHHPLLMEKESQKMSKSANASSIHWMRQQGMSIEQISAQIANHVGIVQPISSIEELEKALIQIWYTQ